MQNKFTEIERKWLINGFPTDLPIVAKGVLQQAYISINPEVRIRKCEMFNEHVSHWLTIKSNGNMTRDEVNIKISKDQYKTLLAICCADPVIKEFKKYELPGGLFLECSHVDSEKDTGFFYAEIEFPDEKSAKAFGTMDIFTKEVTDDPAYKMKNYWNATRNPSTKDDSEDGEDCESETTSDEGECEEDYYDKILDFIVGHVGCIHQHLDQLPFNDAQMAQLEGMMKRVIGGHPVSAEWMGPCELKTGKIKGVMTKKKVKKLIKKELRELLGNKKFKKAVREIAKQETWGTRCDCKTQILNMRRTFGEEIDRMNRSIDTRITKVIEDKACSCHGKREANECHCKDVSQESVNQENDTKA